MTSILAIPGDGIGRDVLDAALTVLGRFTGISVRRADAGFEEFQRTGEAVPESVRSALREVDGVLFGCTGTPSPPPTGYLSPILFLRRELALATNLRYCRSPGGHPLDLVMLRECSEGLYSGGERPIEDGFVADYTVTAAATARLAKEAARVARGRRGVVTVVHKANVLRHADGLFRRTALDVLAREGVQTSEALADAAGYFLVTDPARYDVMMTSNHVGDILSDVAAGVAGSLGLVPSLSFGSRIPLAEPIHGSAPDLVGTGRADPVAMVLSLALLLSELGRRDDGARIERAVHAHLAGRTTHAVTTSAVLVDLLARLDASEAPR